MMTPDATKLAEIRACADRLGFSIQSSYDAMMAGREHIPYLLDLVGKLQKERDEVAEDNRRLSDQLGVKTIGQAACGYCRGEIGVILTTVGDQGQLRSQLTAAESKIKELREALEDIAGETMNVYYDTGFDPPYVPTAGAKKARAILDKTKGETK